jgi:hypothetical protein
MNKITNFYHWLYDVRWVYNLYNKKFDKYFNLFFPSTFNEKINYRKLLDRRPIYTVLCDKIKAKDYVRKRLGEGRTPRTMHIYEHPNEFSPGDVTKKCVLKSNDGWGDAKILEPDDFDSNEVEKTIKEMIEKDHFSWSREWGYYGVESKAFIEEFVRPENNAKVPVDYKYYCFGGKTEMVEIITDRATGDMRSMYTNRDGQPIDLVYCSYSETSELPISIELFNELRDVAEVISQGFDFLRVDMYYSEGNIMIGELTVYPSGGLKHFKPDYWDAHLGSLWDEHRSLKTWAHSMLADTWSPK